MYFHVHVLPFPDCLQVYDEMILPCECLEADFTRVRFLSHVNPLMIHRSHFCANPLLWAEQHHLRSPTWTIFTCTTRVALYVNVFEQTSHVKGYSPGWTLMWILWWTLRVGLHVNAWPHVVLWNSSFLWASKSQSGGQLFLPGCLPHYLQLEASNNTWDVCIWLVPLQ